MSTNLLGTHLVKFDTWQDVIDHVKSGKRVRYYAPGLLPILKIAVTVDRAIDPYTGQRKERPALRIVPSDPSRDPFTATEEHLDRFRKVG